MSGTGRGELDTDHEVVSGSGKSRRTMEASGALSKEARHARASTGEASRVGQGRRAGPGRQRQAQPPRPAGRVGDDHVTSGWARASPGKTVAFFKNHSIAEK